MYNKACPSSSAVKCLKIVLTDLAAKVKAVEAKKTV
jgi:hypothetical protein